MIVTSEQVIAARKRAGLTTEQAGALVHISGRMWRKYESGKSPMNLTVWELFIIKTNQVLERYGQ